MSADRPSMTPHRDYVGSSEYTNGLLPASDQQLSASELNTSIVQVIESHATLLDSSEIKWYTGFTLSNAWVLDDDGRKVSYHAAIDATPEQISVVMPGTNAAVWVLSNADYLAALDAAQAAADQGVSNAATAQSVADQGVSNAATAQAAADQAASNAATAQAAADQGVSNAATAQSVADQAVSNAATAQTTADEAKSKITIPKWNDLSNDEKLSLLANSKVIDSNGDIKELTNTVAKLAYAPVANITARDALTGMVHGDYVVVSDTGYAHYWNTIPSIPVWTSSGSSAVPFVPANGKIDPSLISRSWKFYQSYVAGPETTGKVTYKMLYPVSVSSELSANYGLAKLAVDSPFISGSAVTNSAWMATHNDLPVSAIFKKPIGVVIGDSIAEGHPNTHGRLHNTEGLEVLTLPNARGQLSFELGLLTNMYWYNHGIGGQTTVQTKARWEKDVLGIPTTHLERKADFVVISAGINDVALDVPEATIFSNLEYFFQSAKTNNISAVYIGIGWHQNFTLDQLSRCDRINAFVQSIASKYSVHYFDAKTWANLPGTNTVNSAFFFDYVHPSTMGYADMATRIYSDLGAKMRFDQISIETMQIQGSSVSNYGRPVNLKLTEGTESIITKAKNTPYIRAEVPRLGDPTSKQFTIEITTSTPLTGTGIYTGFARVRAILEKAE